MSTEFHARCAPNRFLIFPVVLALVLLSPFGAESADWIPMDSGTDALLMGVWGFAGDDVFVCGYRLTANYDEGVILHFDGTGWTPMSMPPDVRSLYALWGSSPSDVFAGGEPGLILHYDGTTWSKMISGTTWWIRSIWGSGPTDVFAITEESAIYHFDGSSWQRMPYEPISTLTGIWGSAPNDIYSVGWGPSIHHYDGLSWNPVSHSLSSPAFSIWGSSGSDIFLAGYMGFVGHFDGADWSEMPAPTAGDLSGVWGSGPTDVFAVGEHGGILHYDGMSWEEMDSGTRTTLKGVWGNSPTDVFAVGLEGTILHYAGAPITVSLDIKPGACPNPLSLPSFRSHTENANSKKGGVLPVAIAGTSSFDVADIDVATLRLEGIRPLRHTYEDVTSPHANAEECGCASTGPDGLTDLTLKFQTSEISAVIGTAFAGEVVSLELTGALLDGTRIKGVDCVTIVGKRGARHGLPPATLVIEDAFYPWWSPDGSELICSRPEGNYSDDYFRIWRVEPTGANPQLVVDDPAGAFFPLWLPVEQSQFILYDRGGTSPPYEFVLYDIVQHTEEWVYTLPSVWDDPGYSLSPSGVEMLYTVSGPTDEIWMLDLTDESTRYVGDGQGGAISLDGNWIAFNTEDIELSVAPLDFGTSRILATGAMPSWTPDSEYIVYTGVVNEDQLDLFVTNRDGSFVRQLTDDLDWELYAAVSPDGRQVAYQRGAGEFSPQSIWVLDLSTVIRVGRPVPNNPDVFAVSGNQQSDRNLEETTYCRLAGPNPTNPSSSFEFKLKEAGIVRLEIYDVRGRLIRQVVSEKKPAGDHLVTWSGKDENGQQVSSGVYFYLFEAGSHRSTGKITVVR